MVGVAHAVKAVMACIAYLAVGPVLILYNKYVLKDLGFSYPMFVSGLGLMTTSACAHLIVNLGFHKLEHKKTVTTNFFLTKILPCGAFTAGSHTFGNGAYMFITVAFVQMLKSFTPLLVLVMLGLLGIDIPSKEVAMAVAILCFGTAVSSFGEINMNWIGFSFMVMAALCESGRLVLQQLLLQNLKFSAIEGQYYLVPGAAVCIFFASALFEGPRIVENGHLAIITENPSAFFMCGIMGLAINHVSFLVIQYSNAVTIKVLGMVRNALLVLFTVFVQGEQVTGLQFFGYAITLFGFGLYNYFKMTQKKIVQPSSTSPGDAVLKSWGVEAQSGGGGSRMGSPSGGGGAGAGASPGGGGKQTA